MTTPPSKPEDQWLWGLVGSLRQLGLNASSTHAAPPGSGELRISCEGEPGGLIIANGPEGTAIDRFRAVVAAAVEQQSTIDGFTSQLMELYDTIELLYATGRAQRDLSRPRPFIEHVLTRLHRTLSFSYFAIRFEPSACNTEALSSLLLVEGEPPVASESFNSAVRTCPVPPVLQGWAVLPSLPGLPANNNGQVLVQSIRCRSKTVGIIIAGGKFGDDPCVSSHDIQLVQAAAGHIDSFCDNVSLFEDQRALFMGTVRALTAAIDAKDRYTFGHSERVSLVSAQIAAAMGLPSDEVEIIRLSGLVHDVGKIGVPEEILRKPAALTDDEFAQVKKHPEIGANILDGIPQLANVLPGVLHHHERWDGRGYPHGLKGEDIPLHARIIGVADTFDAMSSSRAYRSGMPREKVLRIIAESAGTQLDARVVEAFQRISLDAYDAAITASPLPQRQAA